MKTKQLIKVVILDFDNTLFDWFEFWYKSFRALIDEIINISGISEDKLVPHIKKVHEKYGTSEYSFLLEELEILKEKLSPGENILEVYKKAIASYRLERHKYLRLYPTVYPTLIRLKKLGVKIIIYTESQDYYSKMRMKFLHLDGVADLLFSPEEQRNGHINLDEKRSKSPDFYELQFTELKKFEKGHKKPNPVSLQEIISDLKAKKEECVYVGDNLSKDILMANQAGITSVWARYGVSHHKEGYELLRKVTHWTQKEVNNEKESSQQKIIPNFEINEFKEILELFDFVPATV